MGSTIYKPVLPSRKQDRMRIRLCDGFAQEKMQDSSYRYLKRLKELTTAAWLGVEFRLNLRATFH